MKIRKRAGGRPKLDHEQLHVHVPAALAAEVRLILLDPSRNRVKYGEMSGLVASLLAEWLEKQRRPTSTDEAPKEELTT